MARVFLDSGVLVTAARGEYPLKSAARQLLSDPSHSFLTSPFVYLETAPKARYNQRTLELAFYQIFFEHAEWMRDVQQIVELGIDLAERYGVGPMDALHIAAAVLLEADELVTVGESVTRASTGMP